MQWKQGWEQETLKTKCEHAQRSANKTSVTVDYKSLLVTEIGV